MATNPTKRRVAIKVVAPPKNAATLTPNPTVQTVADKEAEGSVTVIDRAKQYWKGIIAFAGVALLVIDQLTPIFPANWDHPVAVIVGVLTVIGTFGKSNELWVNDDEPPTAEAA